MSEATRLTIRRPDDWHLHLRDGEMLARVLPASAAHYARAIIMPNLVPPVVTVADARAYLNRISAHLNGAEFEPLMTLYLTEATDPADVRAGAGFIKGLKLYPAGATTNSDAGVRDLDKAFGVLETMAEIGLPLLVHGEVVDDAIDIFDREAVFIDQVLDPLRRRLPALKVVFEHLTTKDGVDYVLANDRNLAATVTPHHLLINRNAMLVGGIQPHHYCLPVPKRETHREALAAAVTSGDKRFFLGTDSAPHPKADKESDCGCAGIYNVPTALACYAHVFEAAGALDKLEGFAALNGPEFYGLPANEGTLTLIKRDVAEVPRTDGDLTIFHPPFPLRWQVL